MLLLFPFLFFFFVVAGQQIGADGRRADDACQKSGGKNHSSVHSEVIPFCGGAAGLSWPLVCALITRTLNSNPFESIRFCSAAASSGDNLPSERAMSSRTGSISERSIANLSSPRWVAVGSMQVPQSPAVFGPERSSGSWNTCFAHDPSGALLAAMNLWAEGTAVPAGELFQRLAVGAPKDLGNGAQLDTSGPVQFAGYRYDAYAPSDAQVAIHDRAETTASVWIDPEEALDRFSEGTFPLVFATEQHLLRLAAFHSIDEMVASTETADLNPVTPRVAESDGKQSFLLPEDPGYDSTS